MIVDFNTSDEQLIRTTELTNNHILIDELQEWISIYTPYSNGYTALYLSDMETIDQSFETLAELATYMHTEHGDRVEAFNNLQVDVKVNIQERR